MPQRIQRRRIKGWRMPAGADWLRAEWLLLLAYTITVAAITLIAVAIVEEVRFRKAERSCLWRCQDAGHVFARVNDDGACCCGDLVTP